MRMEGKGGTVMPTGGSLAGTDLWLRLSRVPVRPCAKPALPLAGFSIIEADSLDEVVQLVADTPCARAKGAIEIRPFWDFRSESSERKR